MTIADQGRTRTGARRPSLSPAAIAGGRLDTHCLGTWSTLAVGGIVGGGIGNLIDRIVRPPGVARRAVVDWIAIDPYPRYSTSRMWTSAQERPSSSGH